MKNRVLVIGVGAFQIVGLKYLREQGYVVVGVDGNPNAAGRNLCDAFFHEDISQKEEILKIAEKEKVDFAIGFECDPAVESINYVNNCLKMSGLNSSASRASMDKVFVRRLQNDLNLNCPEFCEIYQQEDLSKAVKDSEKKWVLKPKASSGSRGVQLLDRNSDFNKVFASSAKYKGSENEPLLLEEFIDGKEIALDGFCHRGICEVLSVSYKDRTDPPYLLDTGLLISTNTSVPLVEDAKAQLQTIFSSLQPDLSSPFHAEFLFNSDGVYLVEFSFRGAGFNVFSKWIPLITGFNTLEFSIKQISEKASWSKQPAKYKKTLYLGFLSGRDGRIKKIIFPKWISDDPQLFESKIYVNEGDSTQELKSGADRLGHLVLLSDDESKLREKFLMYEKEIKFEYE